MIEVPYDVSQAGAVATTRFLQMVNAGQSPRMAEMLALQRPPNCVTDREFFAQHRMLADDIGDDPVLKKMVKLAKKRGGNPGPNDVYVSAIADGVGDPLAFVPPTGGRGHIKKVLQERNWEADGIVNTKREQRPPKRRRLSKMALSHLMLKYRESPEHSRTPERELVQLVTEKHSKPVRRE